MGLETFDSTTNIWDFVIANPVGASDSRRQGDDHLRGIKRNVTQTFLKGTTAARPAAGEADRLYFDLDEYEIYWDDGSQWNLFSAAAQTGSVPAGLQLSRDGGTSTKDINVTAGSCLDSLLATDMILTSEITKQMDATWAVGDDVGGAEPGFSIPADGIVYVWLVKRTDTGVIDVVISESAASPTLTGALASYDKERLIGAWQTVSSNLLSGTHRGISWTWDDYTVDVFDASPPSGFTLATVTCPPNCIYKYSISIDTTNGDNTDLGVYTTTAGGASNDVEKEPVGGVVVEIDSSHAAILETIGTTSEQLVNGSSQLKYRKFTDGSNSRRVTIACLGWEMLTRNDP